MSQYCLHKDNPEFLYVLSQYIAAGRIDEMSVHVWVKMQQNYLESPVGQVQWC